MQVFDVGAGVEGNECPPYHGHHLQVVDVDVLLVPINIMGLGGTHELGTQCVLDEDPCGTVCGAGVHVSHLVGELSLLGGFELGHHGPERWGGQEEGSLGRKA
jgi:hypothetical protein